MYLTAANFRCRKLFVLIDKCRNAHFYTSLCMYIYAYIYYKKNTRNIIGTLYSRCPLDEGREYVLGVLFLVLFALFCIFFIIFIFYISFLLHFAQLDYKILVLSFLNNYCFFHSFIAF